MRLSKIGSLSQLGVTLDTEAINELFSSLFLASLAGCPHIAAVD